MNGCELRDAGDLCPAPKIYHHTRDCTWAGHGNEYHERTCLCGVWCPAGVYPCRMLHDTVTDASWPGTQDTSTFLASWTRRHEVHAYYDSFIHPLVSCRRAPGLNLVDTTVRVQILPLGASEWQYLG